MLFRKKQKAQPKIELTPEAQKALELAKEEQKKFNSLAQGEFLTNDEKLKLKKALEQKKAVEFIADSIKKKEKAERDLEYYQALDAIESNKALAVQKYKHSKGNFIVTVIVGLVLLYVGWVALQPPYGEFSWHNKGDYWDLGLWSMWFGFLALVLAPKLLVSKADLDATLEYLADEEDKIRFPSANITEE